MNQLGFIIACVLTSGAIGQAFNIDFDAASGAGAGVPSASYGGAARTPGHWNRITSSSPMTVSLRSTENKSSTFKLTRVKSGTIQSFADADLSADAAALMCDADAIDGPGDLEYVFSGIPAVKFWVYVYGLRPGSENRCLISVDGGKAWPVGSDPADDSLIAGKTHFIGGVSKYEFGSTITVRISESEDGSATCGGIQLRIGNNEIITLRVDPLQTGPQDGFTWQTALRSLHDALHTTNMIDDSISDVIYLKRGIYPTTSGIDRNVSFTLSTGTGLYGGFEGTEQTPDERLRENLTNGSTTLTGEIGSPGASDNAYHVMRSIGKYAGSLDGITITRGYADGPDDDSDGGGAYFVGSAARESFVTWSDDYAARDGGAVCAPRTQGGLLCTYVGNVAGRHGGAVAGRKPTGSDQVEYMLCRFVGNHAGGDGGAIFGRHVSIELSFFAGNSAGGDGGALNIRESPFAIYSSTIAGNRALGSGGGVYTQNHSRTLECGGSLFWGNRSSDVTLIDQQIGGELGGGWMRRCVIEGRDDDPQLIDLDGTDDVLGTLDDSPSISKWSSCTDQSAELYVPTDVLDVDDDGKLRERVERDFIGQWRFVDFPSITQEPPIDGREPDIGCFEVQRCWADYNDDDDVTAGDVEAYVADFVNGALSADLNYDTFVTGDDFDAFVAAFDLGC